MKKLFLLAALCFAAAFSSCSHDDGEINDVEPPVVPEPQPLAIAFAEGNSLQFDVDETKTVHYTITGGSDKTVIKAEMQKSDDAYILKTTPTSAIEGTIAITAKTPETENCVVVTVSDGDRSITAEIAVSTNAIPEKLTITFAEGNSLELGVNETKTIHYTITGGSDNTVVKAEMQTPDNVYTVKTTPTSATEGTITITAQMPTDNRVIVTVSDGSQTVTAEIVVTLNAFDGKTAVVETPGTLSQLLTDHDESAITELTVIGNLNDEDIAMLNKLPKLTVLDMENANLEVLPAKAFYKNISLTSVKLPKTLRFIGAEAFYDCDTLTSITIPDSVTTILYGAFDGCSSLTSVIIPNSVTTIGSGAFASCSSLTSVTIPDSVTLIRDSAFYNCSGLSAFYGKFASSDNRCLIVKGELIAFAPAGLTSYTIPDGVTTIGNNAFRGYSNLTNITIPNSVMEIRWAAFESCNGLTSIVLPENVTSIDGSIFTNCNRLTSIYCKAQTPPSVGGNPFRVSATLYVPIGSKAAYAAADQWKNFTIIETQF